MNPIWLPYICEYEYDDEHKYKISYSHFVLVYQCVQPKDIELSYVPTVFNNGKEKEKKNKEINFFLSTTL